MVTGETPSGLWDSSSPVWDPLSRVLTLDPTAFVEEETARGSFLGRREWG